VWVLLFLLTSFAWAQPFGAPKPMFPDDTQDPKQAGGAQLLEAVCPGDVVAGKDIECKASCPKDSGFPGQDWTLERVLQGHFRSPTSDDAVLAMSGCEAHSENFGGTILLTRQSAKWTMLWYKGGVPTAGCHRVTLQDKREILICLSGEYGGQGYVSRDLYVEDLLTPKEALMADSETAFFSSFDDTGTCGHDFENPLKPFPITLGFIDRVQFNNAVDGTLRGLTVFGRYGERPMTLAQAQACIDEYNPTKPHHGLSFRPPTRPYRVDFKFDGKQMVRAGGSPGAPKSE
jgi:hypothetical protein